MTKAIPASEILSVKQLINSFDWEKTSLGKQESWSPNLKAILLMILNSSLPMVIYWGRENTSLYNDAYAKIIGAKHPSLLGRPLIEMWPERKAHFNQIVSALYQKETIRYTTNYHTPGSINNHSAQAQAQIEVTFNPILDEHNQVQGMLSIVTQMHKPTTEPTQKIDELIGGLAHDFNTLLAGIVGNLELMQMRINQNKYEMLPHYIKAAQKAATQATDITHQLLSFSRRQILLPHVIDPNHTIQALLDIFYSFIKNDKAKKHIDIQIQLEPDVWSIFCDPEHLKNAIFHIFKNACEAIHSSHGQILIKTQNITITSTHPLRKYIKPDDYIAFIIQDNGAGMSPDMISRATDPFFTTKPLGKRAGLGLSMAFGFTKQSSGHLTIDSDQKTGSTISLFLPRYYRPLVIQKLYDNTEKANGLKTLLISQDNHLCMLLSENLEGLGYSMTIAQTEKETFTLLKSDNSFSFLAIDVRLLPEASADFLTKIKDYYSGIPIVFITGYEETPIILKHFIDEQSFVIRKPITDTMLADCIQAIEASKQSIIKREE